jgi:hypothetical protein
MNSNYQHALAGRKFPDVAIGRTASTKRKHVLPALTCVGGVDNNHVVPRFET